MLLFVRAVKCSLSAKLIDFYNVFFNALIKKFHAVALQHFARVHVGSDGQPPAGLCVRPHEVACAAAAARTAFKRAGV